MPPQHSKKSQKHKASGRVNHFLRSRRESLQLALRKVRKRQSNCLESSCDWSQSRRACGRGLRNFYLFYLVPLWPPWIPPTQ